MPTVPSSNIELNGDINAEVSSVNTGSLTTLSTNAIPAKSAPHGMKEFAGYTHFSSQSTTGTFSQFTQGKLGNVRRRMSNLTDTTLQLGSGSTIYNISFIESEPSTGPGTGDTDHRQNIQIFGYVSGNQTSNPPNAWSTLTMGGSSSITWSLSRSAMLSSVSYSSSANLTYWNFSTGITGSTIYLPSSGTGTLTFS